MIGGIKLIVVKMIDVSEVIIVALVGVDVLIVVKPVGVDALIVVKPVEVDALIVVKPVGVGMLEMLRISFIIELVDEVLPVDVGVDGDTVTGDIDVNMGVFMGFADEMCVGMGCGIEGDIGRDLEADTVVVDENGNSVYDGFKRVVSGDKSRLVTGGRCCVVSNVVIKGPNLIADVGVVKDDKDFKFVVKSDKASVVVVWLLIVSNLFVVVGELLLVVRGVVVIKTGLVMLDVVEGLSVVVASVVVVLNVVVASVVVLNVVVASVVVVFNVVVPMRVAVVVCKAVVMSEQKVL